MSSCQKCQMLAHALKNEIEDRQLREQQLMCSNNNLTYLLNSSQPSLQDQVDWKEKYEKQREITRVLQSKIKQQKKEKCFLYDRKINSLYQPYVFASITKRSSSKENSQFKHAKQMSEVMKALVIERKKQRQYSSQLSHRESGSKQVILRIVDERINQQF